MKVSLAFLPSTRVRAHISLPSFLPSFPLKVLAVLYSGGKAAEEESRLLGTTENKVSLAELLFETRED